MIEISKKKIMLTGGAGFLGSFVSAKLKARGCEDVFIPKEQEYDLVTAAAVKKVFRVSKPDIVIHLAAKVGGIGANRENPGKFFYDNLVLPARGVGAYLSKTDYLLAIFNFKFNLSVSPVKHYRR